MCLTACAVLRLQMLGIQASEREVQEVCATAGHNGELNYLDFVGVGHADAALYTMASSPVQAALIPVLPRGRQTPAPSRQHAAAAGLNLPVRLRCELIVFPADECPCMQRHDYTDVPTRPPTCR